jgi:hypothetical protein
MTCRRIGGAIVCGRPRRKARREVLPCRWAGCDKQASQASWGCRHHWYQLPPGLRSRLWQADRDERAATGRPGAAWRAAADEAQRWMEEKLAKPPGASDRRQPELDL